MGLCANLPHVKNPKLNLKPIMKKKDCYIQFLSLARNLSPTTCKHYSDIMHVFAEFLQSAGLDEREVTNADVTRWVMQQASHGIKAVTINNRLVAMRRYYDYCVRLHEYPSNPFVGIEPLKVPKLLPKYIPATTIQRVVDSLSTSSFDGVRAAAIIMTFFCTGIRRSELTSLSAFDVDVSSRVVHVFGKGRKERITPIPDKLVPYLLRWQSIIEDSFAHRPLTYFCNDLGERLNETFLWRLFHEVFAGFVERKLQHPHVLRHSYATTLMQAGVPIVDIARLLGHSSVATTMRYLSLSPSSQYSATVNAVFQ